MSTGAIILVEDNPITRKMLRVSLEVEGYDVLDGLDGKTALELAAARPPDLLIVDFVLPDMDGLQLITAVRHQLSAPALPAILITGMVSRLDELRTRAGAFTQVLAKPIEPSQLLEVVRAQLEPALSRAGDPRVLVVDDEPLNLKLATFRLKRDGYMVDTAGSGEAALEIVRRRRPDAILSDVMMPSMDGFSLCRELRRMPELAGVPIVLASSAYVDEADRELARQMGANALVVRTPDLHEALAAIESALRAGPRPPPPAAMRDVTALHRERLQVQLERQTERNEALTRQAAIQATALSIVRGLSEVLSEPREVPQILGDVLVHCLDAAGLSTGLLYVTGQSHGHRLQAQFGIPADRKADAEEVFGHRELLDRIIRSGKPVALSAADVGDDPEARDFLARIGYPSVLILPFVVLGETFGELVLASESHDLSDSSWITFARNLALQFGQTVALGQAMSRLAASESRYRGLMEQAHEAILILDRQARVLEANRAAEVLLGRPRAEVVGRRYDEFVAPDEQRESMRRHEQLLVDGALRVATRQMVRPDGTQVAVEASGALVRMAEESVVLTILRDITERNRAEAALRETQQQLQHVVASSPAVLYALRFDDATMTMIPSWVSANVERVIGYQVAEANREGWWFDRLHPEDRERVLEQIQELLAKGSIVREYRLRHKDGGYRWLRDEQIMVTQNGEREVIGSWSDVTERKEAERKLHESEEQYRLLFDSNPSPMWVFDVETLAFLAVNDAAVSHYGWTREEFLAMRITDIRPPEVLPALMADVAELRKDLRRVSPPGTWRHRKKDGTEIDVEVVATSIVFQGRAARLTLVADVTEKTALQAQLVRSQRMEAVGQLAGGIAHDFNNLLGVITGYSELLIRSVPTDSVERRRGEEIKAAADRAAALTRQLLAFSRRQILQPTILDLGVVVDDVVKMLRRVISEDIQIVVESAPGLGSVRADAGQLEQVIMNLAVNARDAMPAGGRLRIGTANVTLDQTYVRASPNGKAGEWVRLEVSDTGQGMSEATRARVFEPFFTTKEEGKGTGLGLATVYGIVEQSGGWVNVYSELGLGTTFNVYLPRVPDAVQLERVAAVEPAAGGGETILLVEDAEPLRVLVCELLASAGYSVLEADGPEKALEIAQAGRQRIDLVLTDMVMPRMSGQELAKRLSVLQPEATIVFMSGYSEQAMGDQGTLPAGTHFLQKPFTMDALLRTIRRAFSGNGENRSAESD